MPTQLRLRTLELKTSTSATTAAMRPTSPRRLGAVGEDEEAFLEESCGNVGLDLWEGFVRCVLGLLGSLSSGGGRGRMLRNFGSHVSGSFPLLGLSLILVLVCIVKSVIAVVIDLFHSTVKRHMR